MWDVKPPKIKSLTAIGQIYDGGIKLPYIHHYITAQKALWVKRLYSVNNNHMLAYIQEYLPDMHFSEILKLSVGPNLWSGEMPYFYRQVLHAWYQLKKSPTEIHEILYEIVWHNKDIKINGKSVIYQDWYDAGVVYSQDLVIHDGYFFKYKDFTNHFRQPTFGGR